jgi:hypothetical protein
VHEEKPNNSNYKTAQGAHLLDFSNDSPGRRNHSLKRRHESRTQVGRKCRMRAHMTPN